MRILIVDDSPTTRKIIRRELEQEDYEVVEAKNGEEALAGVADMKPDLITLDANMPGMSGFEVCSKIREQEKKATSKLVANTHLPVVFVTANDTVEGRERGFEVGATHFVTKPFEHGELLEIVNHILKPEPIWLGITALVAEDSVLFRNIVVNALKRLGVDVLEAGDGVEALALARAHQGRIDMVVSDYLMPKMNGDELCIKIRTELGKTEIPIIMLSAYDEKSAILNLFRAGATDYLTKPFSLEELLARIKVHLNTCLLNRDLSQRVQQMEEELGLAREVQQATIHDRVSVPFLEKKVVYESLSEVSGDIYDFAVDGEEGLRIFLGDATGHGVGAAFMTMMVQIGLDSAGVDITVSGMLKHLHELVVERTHDRFVTGVYARLLADGTLTLASAGHPPAIVVPSKGAVSVCDGGSGMPLGLLDEPLPFKELTLQLAPGDKVFFYTDGITEWANKKGELFGLDRLVAAAVGTGGQSIAEAVEKVMADVRRFSQGVESGDDVTLVAVQYL